MEGKAQVCRSGLNPGMGESLGERYLYLPLNTAAEAAILEVFLRL